ncbi:MAG TPA: hypothetical protein VK892_04495, partial [Pyrinomonadaceae bacterium]|nr:hypothetical protein [Pyrinomonadaceae bacterium]
MNNLADIGRSEKRKYPGVYDQWTDEEVGQAVIDRDLNEGRTDMAAVAWNGAIADIALVDTGLRELLFADPALAGKIQQSFDYYDPRLGVFSNWLRRLRGEGRNKLLEVLNQEQKLLIEQAAILERQVREGKREQVEYHLFVARNISELMALKANAEVNRQAFGSGMNPDHYSQVNYEKALSEMRTKEHRDKSEIDLATKIQESEHILVKTRE